MRSSAAAAPALWKLREPCVRNSYRSIATAAPFSLLRITRSEERRVGSDWSSDVCSSDLHAQFGGRGARTLEVARTLRAELIPFNRYGGAFFVAADHEIGRASCRERV